MNARSFPLAVYVHIPFCAYRCRYCNFTFETGWSDSLVDRTLDAIVLEAREFRRKSDEAGHAWDVRTLYVGGGTPSVVPVDRIPEFFRRLKDALGVSPEHRWAEATFEINPENMSADLLDALAGSGIDRLSVGIQTFDDAQLSAMGRRCDRASNERALSLVRDRWKGSWSVDVMTGFPGQRWTDVRRDLDVLADYEPPHVSLYSLIVEPKTALAKQIETGKLVPLDASVQDQLWIRASETLQSEGYSWYEISNFARAERESKHNFFYWNLDAYVGLGPGAAGTIRSFDEPGAVVRTQNPRLFPYLAGERAIETLTPSDFYLEHLLSGLRTCRGVSLRRLEAIFGADVALAARKLRAWTQERGWSDPEAGENWLQLNDRGRLALDRVLIEVETPEKSAFLPKIRWPFEDRNGA